LYVYTRGFAEAKTALDRHAGGPRSPHRA
jgi:hypothetical protein